MTKKVFLGILVLLVWGCLVARAEVLSQEYCKLYGAHFWGINTRGFPTSSKYIMTDFGPGNIRLLERIDIVLDDFSRIDGIQIVYKTPDGIKRQVFLHHVKGWVLEKTPSPNAVSKEVLIRIVTPESLIGH